MNLGTRLRGRPRNRWQDEVREDGRIVGGEGWQEKVHNRGMEEAPGNGKELSHSAHASGMNEHVYDIFHILSFIHSFIFIFALHQIFADMEAVIII
jgi:hypothetical protein